MARIRFMDTTLRDGEQTPGVSFTVREKLEIAKALEEMGVDVIEGGFAAASDGDIKALGLMAREIKRSQVCSLCRTYVPDIDAAAGALKGAESSRIHVFIATSDIHMQHKLRMSREQVLELTRNSVAYARRFCESVEFSAEDASRSDRDFLCTVLEAAIAAGADVINIPDTVGYIMPEEYRGLISYVRSNVKNADKAIFSVHCHDDLGLAVANTLAGIEAGALQAECTVNGIGERAGNAALEEIIMLLTTRAGASSFTHGIDTTRISRVSRLVSYHSGVMIPVNKAIVGQNAFVHQSGIHQHGMLNDKSTYQIISPEQVGSNGENIVLGKLSGRHAFERKCIQFGYSLSPEDIDTAFTRFKEAAERDKVLSEEDIAIIIADVAEKIPRVYKLVNFQISSANHAKSTAMVTLDNEGTEISDAAIGEGPVDAAYNAVNKLVKREFSLESYSLSAVTEGTDALGEAKVKVTHEGRTVRGRGVSSDILRASIKAYLSAVNRILCYESEASDKH